MVLGQLVSERYEILCIIHPLQLLQIAYDTFREHLGVVLQLLAILFQIWVDSILSGLRLPSDS